MKRLLIISFLFGLIFNCSTEKYEWKTQEVTATAYNSLASQTDGDPFIAAWGDSLIVDKKYIAVSRDLLKNGLVRNTLVTIDGLEGVYLVKDKMNKRWNNRIDIYMGTNKKKAREWGRRKVTIRYRVKKEKPE